MKPVHFQIKVLTLLIILGIGPVQADEQADVLDVEVRRLSSDQVVNLKQEYAGKVVLIVNTASRCAFTDQYEGLEALHAEYRERGLVVLGFPSNDFGAQEPGTEARIRDFCRLTYGVKFPMFAKTHVREGTADPLFTALGETAGRYPQWNFHKYLVDRDGRLVDDYPSITPPQGKTIVSAVERLL